MPRVLVRQDNSTPGIIAYVGEYEIKNNRHSLFPTHLRSYPISTTDYPYIEENELIGKYTEICVENGIAEIFHFDPNLLT